MKLTHALIFSVCTLSTGLAPCTILAAKASSGEVKASNEMLMLELSQEREKVKSLEAEIAELRSTVDSLKAMLAGAGGTASVSNPQAPQKYVIEVGETITQIANRHNISREKLMELNGIGENQQIYIGDELIIPAAQPVSTEAVTEVVLNESGSEQTSDTAPLIVTTTTTASPTTKATTIAWTEAEKVETDPTPAEQPVTEMIKPEVVQLKDVTPAPEEKLLAVVETEEKPEPEVETVEPTTVEPTTVEPFKSISAIMEESPEPEIKVAEVKAAEEKIQGNDKGYTLYTIKFGDNLGKIAKNHGITIGALMSFNKLTNPDKISGGQKLKIPSKETAKSLSKVKPAASSTVAEASSVDKPLPGDAYGVYTVQIGDTLYGLARDFFTTEKKIQELNDMGDKTNIVPGQDLIVPTAEYFKKSDLATN